jgi:hypothetical protein
MIRHKRSIEMRAFPKFAAALATGRTLAVAAGLVLASSMPGLAQNFMSEDELLATIPGSTIDGKTDSGVAWVQGYSKRKGNKKSGVIKGSFDGQEINSKWFVKDGQWCEDWGSGSQCWQVERIDEKSLRMYENGKPRPNPWVLR